MDERAEPEQEAATNRSTGKPEREALSWPKFDSARKRAAQEQLRSKILGLAEALRSLLPELDSFDRTLQAALQNPDECRSGVELIRKQLDDVISKLGVQSRPKVSNLMRARMRRQGELRYGQNSANRCGVDMRHL